MTAVLITEDNLAHIKGNLRQHFGKQVKSAHLTEAIAAALGRRTHAALLTDLPLPSAHPKAIRGKRAAIEPGHNGLAGDG